MSPKRPGFLLWKLLFLMVILALAALVGYFFYAQRDITSWNQAIQPGGGNVIGSDW